MLISWEWLSDYIKLDESIDKVVDRWALSGLNHESTHEVEGDSVIDLEVTSNRADCLLRAAPSAQSSAQDFKGIGA
jgi:phenylalanyl-tRNA synthetase beta chain